MGKGGGSPPPAPDYVGAAQAQAASSRVNQNTPFGSVNWTPPTSSTAGGSLGSAVAPTTSSGSGAGAGLQSMFDAINAQAGNPTTTPSPLTASTSGSSFGGLNNDPWTQTTTLSPQLQNAATGISSQVGNTYSKPFDMSSVQDIYNKAYGAQTARLDPYWAQQGEQNQTNLANQGLTPGGEAYDNAMRTFNQGRNDAYQQAQTAAINTMPQTYQLGESAYTLPLNLLNAFRTGSQFGGSPTGPATNYTGAAQAAGNYAGDIFNYGQQQQASNTQAETSLASAAMLAYMLA